MPDQSDQPQAAMLIALASHLADHPDLPTVNIMSLDSLHVRYTDDPAGALAKWSASFAEPSQIDVHAIYSDEWDCYRAFCYAVGDLGDGEFRVTVWDVVPDLLEALGGLDALDERRRGAITAAALADFAEDGTAPTVIYPSEHALV